VNDLPEAELRPEQPRRYPSTIGGGCYIVVALTAAAGIGLVALGLWRTGLTALGCGLLFGAAARLVLPDEKAGMLKVRRKSLDVLLLTGLGAALVILAVVVPRTGL